VIEYETTTPPVLVGKFFVPLTSAVPTVKTAGLLEYSSDEGGVSVTVILTEAVVEPLVFVALIV
jgi:hypothetical protein